MFRNFIGVLVVSIIISCSTQANADSYVPTKYIDCSLGGSGGSGTLESPWHALSNVSGLVPGDVVALKVGTTCLGEWDISTSGTSNNPIVITSYGTGDPPIIDPRNARWGINITGAYVVVDGLVIHNTRCAGGAICGDGGESDTTITSTEAAINIATNGHVTVKNTEIVNTGFGIEAWVGNNTLGPNNYIHKLRMLDQGGGFYGAVCWEIRSSNNNVFSSRCVDAIAQAPSAGSGLDGGAFEVYRDTSGTVDNNVFAWNWVDHTDGIAEMTCKLGCTSLSNNIWHHNVFRSYENPAGSWHSMCLTGVTASGNRWENNTLIGYAGDNKYEFAWFENNCAADAVLYRNNIFVLGAHSVVFGNDQSSSHGPAHDHNLYWSVGGSAPTISGGGAGTGDISVNPQFVNIESADYHLQPSSPAIDTGSASVGYTYPGVDYDGSAVPTGSAPDIGAFEYGGTGRVAVPTFNPLPGLYDTVQSVSLSTTTSGATICYTTNGTDPAATSPGTCSTGTTYSTAISVTSTVTIKALATKADSSNSTVVSATYTLAGPGAPTYSSIASTTLTVSWTAEPATTSYYLERKAEGGAWSTIATNISATSYNDTGLTSGGLYYYRVTGEDGAQLTSAESSIRTAKTLTGSVITYTITATDAGGVTGYMVTESSSQPLATNPNWKSSPTGAYRISSLGIHTLYAWAKDAAGNVSSPRQFMVEVVALTDEAILTVDPMNIVLDPSATQDFTATVTGTTNTAVHWSLSPVSTCGSLSSATSNPTTYTAPSSTCSATLTAVSDVDATAVVQSLITVGITPASSSFWSTGYYYSFFMANPASINWTAYTHIAHMGKIPRTDGTLGDDYWTTINATALVSAAHAHNVKVMLTVGGANAGVDPTIPSTWPTDSSAIANMVSTAISIMNTYGYDGIDVDREDDASSSAYLTVIQAFRNALPAGKLLTCATGSWIINRFTKDSAALCDQVNLMSYKYYAADMPGLIAMYESANFPKSKLGVGFGLGDPYDGGEVDTTASECAAKATFAQTSGVGGIMSWGMGAYSTYSTCETNFAGIVPVHGGTTTGYYGSPTGSGSTCSEASPCSLAGLQTKLRGLDRTNVAAILKDGDYAGPLNFTSADSGGSGGRVVWRAEHTGLARILGSTKLTSWTQCNSGNCSAVWSSLPSSAKTGGAGGGSHVWKADISSLGSYPAVLTGPFRGWWATDASDYFGADGAPAGATMLLSAVPPTGFCTGGRYSGGGVSRLCPLPLTLARYPNVDDAGRDSLLTSLGGRDYTGSGSYIQHILSTDNFASHSEDFGTSVDVSWGGYIANAVQELDSAGEYWIDRTNGVTYFWPWTDADPSTSGGEVFVGSVATPTLSFASGANYIDVQGVTVQGGQTKCVSMLGQGDRIINSTIRECPDQGVLIGGSNNVLSGGSVSNIGGDGVVVFGATAATVLGVEVAVTGMYRMTYARGILVGSDGATISLNKIHDSTGACITPVGKNVVIEKNDISRCPLGGTDSGSIYTWASTPTNINLTVRYNYIHDVPVANLPAAAWTTPDFGLYSDDNISGFNAYGNILYSLGHGTGSEYASPTMLREGVLTKGTNIFRNNVFVLVDGWETRSVIGYTGSPSIDHNLFVSSNQGHNGSFGADVTSLPITSGSGNPTAAFTRTTAPRDLSNSTCSGAKCITSGAFTTDPNGLNYIPWSW